MFNSIKCWNSICCTQDPQQNDTANRREQLQKQLIEKFSDSDIDENEVLDTLQVMIRLYSASDGQQLPVQLLKKCRLNPDFVNLLRNDIAYYIPQLINFMVFLSNMADSNLIEFILQACEIDFFIAHQVYFQLYSLSQFVLPKATIEMKAVKRFLQDFDCKMCENYSNTLLIATHLLDEYLDNSFVQHKIPSDKQVINRGQPYKISQNPQPLNDDIQDYGTKFYSGSQQLLVQSHQINLTNYSSVFEENKQVDQDLEFKDQNSYVKKVNQTDQSFRSTIDFWQDLILISQRLAFANPKIISLKADLQLVNQHLPSAVYIPFIKDSIRNYVLLSIVPDESRVFSTKIRSPFSICIEIYRPEQEKGIREKEKSIPLDLTISNPKTLKMLVKQKQKHQLEYHLEPKEEIFSKSMCLNSNFNIQEDQLQSQRKHRVSFSYFKNTYDSDFIQDLHLIRLRKSSETLDSAIQIKESYRIKGIGLFYQTENEGQNEIIYDNNETEEQKYQIDAEKTQHHPLEVQLIQSQDGSQKQKNIILTSSEHDHLKKIIFGESSSEQSARVKRNSPYRSLNSWRLVNIIVKTDDNLQQEQFALQLISQFQQIFQEEKLPLKLTYYEVVSLGPDSGIIEMVKDATTIDSLKKNLSIHRRDLSNFTTFFNSYFHNNYQQALQNYVNSLAAYCLVTFLLQVKDRHNGNILLHSDGSLMHIDFGFFLSNAPGKGIEFESTVPFKLLSEYIEVLGGPESHAFDNFRKLFFRGFQAARKHQDKILILVKMMYSGQGTTLPCFRRGDQAIKDLEARFNPPMHSDGDLSIFIQELINGSLDNWRARWYDKFQYYFQGIFY